MMLASSQQQTSGSNKRGFLGGLRLKSSRRTRSDAIPPSVENATARFGTSRDEQHSRGFDHAAGFDHSFDKRSSDAPTFSSTSSRQTLTELNAAASSAAHAQEAARAGLYDTRPHPTAASIARMPHSASRPTMSRTLASDSAVPSTSLAMADSGFHESKKADAAKGVNKDSKDSKTPKPPRGTLNSAQKLAYLDWRLENIRVEQDKQDTSTSSRRAGGAGETSTKAHIAAAAIEQTEYLDDAPATETSFPPGVSIASQQRSRRASANLLDGIPMSIDPQRKPTIRIQGRPSTAEVLGSTTAKAPGQFSRLPSSQTQSSMAGSQVPGLTRSRSQRETPLATPSSFSGTPGGVKRSGSVLGRLNIFGKARTPADPSMNSLSLATSPNSEFSNGGGFFGQQNKFLHGGASVSRHGSTEEGQEVLADGVSPKAEHFPTHGGYIAEDQSRRMLREAPPRPVSRAGRPVSRSGHRESAKGDVGRWTKIAVVAMGGFAPQYASDDDDE
ncbi:hypothetical protein CBOM_06204 [Ceraceosorus bombacis]|uniref:Uncharacterized protein n=1 Tax=Ceraceosorus bombacis TaxID=401625 RepID=A0A0P1BJV5_9BASI|nr:hypothetical protein CBOM_06204 [Ceraceosorus bombacis]